jgi:hypothetical protein
MQKKTKMYEAPQVLVETNLETATVFAQSEGESFDSETEDYTEKNGYTLG